MLWGCLLVGTIGVLLWQSRGDRGYVEEDEAIWKRWWGTLGLALVPCLATFLVPAQRTTYAVVWPVVMLLAVAAAAYSLRGVVRVREEPPMPGGFRLAWGALSACHLMGIHALLVNYPYE